MANLISMQYLSNLDRHAALGRVLLRLFIGGVLMYGTGDNIVSAARMEEFRIFLDDSGFAYPTLSAYVSVYAQFICGGLIILGYQTRLAALVMVVNFLVALWMVHWGLPFEANIAPMAMLVGSIYLLLNGAGEFSVDARGSDPHAGTPEIRPGTYR